MNLYPCTLIRVVDGDTLILDINFGLSMPGPDRDLGIGLVVRGGILYATHERVRLCKVNAPEMSLSQGITSKDFVTRTLEGKNLTVAISKRERYGRILGDVFVDNISLSEILVAAKEAVPYMT